MKLFFNTENGDLPVDGMGYAVLRQTQMDGSQPGECEGRKNRNVEQFRLTYFWNLTLIQPFKTWCQIMGKKGEFSAIKPGSSKLDL